MNLDGREHYFLAVTIFEWIEAEALKPANRKRQSDMADLEELLEREFSSELALTILHPAPRSRTTDGGMAPSSWMHEQEIDPFPPQFRLNIARKIEV